MDRVSCQVSECSADLVPKVLLLTCVHPLPFPMVRTRGGDKSWGPGLQGKGSEWAESLVTPGPPKAWA